MAAKNFVEKTSANSAKQETDGTDCNAVTPIKKRANNLAAFFSLLNSHQLQCNEPSCLYIYV